MTMELILQDIQRALDARAWYAALMAIVVLPEICGRCEREDMYAKRGSNEMVFKRFVETYLPNWRLHLTGKDLYNLRCGLSHRGQLTQRNTAARYVFIPPDFPNIRISHGQTIKGGETTRITNDLLSFWEDIAAAVRRWEADHAGNAVVQKNLEEVIRPREGSFGTGIHIEGVQYLA